MRQDQINRLLEVHEVTLEINLGRLPWPIPSRRLGGRFRLPVESIFSMGVGYPGRGRGNGSKRHDSAKASALGLLTRGLEDLVHQIEDLIRTEWDMESRAEKAKREAEEYRDRMIHTQFQAFYYPYREIPKPVGLWPIPTVETEDYPLGEYPPL